MNEASVITYGIGPGAKMAGVKDKNAILKLRPVQSHAAWKTTSISVGPEINPQTHMFCNGDGEDDVAFCLYSIGSDKGTFVFKYHLTLEYPIPN